MQPIPIVLRAFLAAVLFVLLKQWIFSLLSFQGEPLNALIESSDISILITGCIFVLGMMLAGTLTDFKEGEKIPGEIATILEAMQDWIMLGLRSPRTGNFEKAKEPLDAVYLFSTLKQVTSSILSWLQSREKDSKVIFPELRKLNDLSYYFAEHGADKDTVKGIQENTNLMRKQITRAYSISRSVFVAPAYTLLKGIIVTAHIILLATKFKSGLAGFLIPLSLSFIFISMYYLIKGLDDPFDIGKGDAEVDIKPIKRFRERLEQSFPAAGA